MNVKDRSNAGAPAPTHYSGRLVTSDSRAHAETAQTLGTGTDGQPSQAARIPSEKPYPEVSEIYGTGEACTAEVADHGGREGNGSQAEGATGLDKSAATPVIARPDNLEFTKSAHVGTHPSLMRAHQTGSYSASDHDAVHGTQKCEPLSKPGSNLPKGGEGVAEALDESTVGQSPASEGSTMPNVAKTEIADETLWAEATKGVKKALRPVRAGQREIQRSDYNAITTEMHRRGVNAVMEEVDSRVVIGSSGGDGSEPLTAQVTENVTVTGAAVYSRSEEQLQEERLFVDAADERRKKMRPKEEPVFLQPGSGALATVGNCSALRSGGPMRSR
jgi:hypothetical protein